MANNTTMAEHHTGDEEMEIDLMQVAKTLLRHVRAIVVWTVLGAVLAAGVTFFLPRSFTASTLLYVNYTSTASGILGGSPYTTTTDSLNAASSLVDTFGLLLMHGETLDQVIRQSGMDCDVGELENNIEYEATGGQMIAVRVTADDADQAAAAARAIGDVMPEKLSAQVEGCRVNVVEAGRLQSSDPAWKRYALNALIGALAGLAGSCAVFAMFCAADRHIYAPGYLTAAWPGVPLLTQLPDGQHAAGGASEEAYKLLRTYLVFPPAGAPEPRVIGVTSSLAGEGKTAAAVGLARALTQAGKRVVLLEGDMRHPSLAQALGLSPDGPGLAALLAGEEPDVAVRGCAMGFDAAVCGTVPSEPSELVCSERMRQVVERMRGAYDYVLIDLPAVMEAADAVAVSRMADGMLLLVRAGRADQPSLAESLRRLEVADGRVLGFVFNGALPSKKDR